MRVSPRTLKKIRKSKKSRSKSLRHKKHTTNSLKLSPQQYYLAKSSYSSSSKITQNGVTKSHIHGLSLEDSSNSKDILVREMHNGKVIETHIPKPL